MMNMITINIALTGYIIFLGYMLRSGYRQDQLKLRESGYLNNLNLLKEMLPETKKVLKLKSIYIGKTNNHEHILINSKKDFYLLIGFSTNNEIFKINKKQAPFYLVKYLHDSNKKCKITSKEFDLLLAPNLDDRVVALEIIKSKL